MKIGIYAMIPYGAYGGVQPYIEKLVESLLAYTDEQVIVITNKEYYDHFFKKLESNCSFTCVIGGNDEFQIKKMVEDLKLDVLHFPFQTFPYYYWKVPTVVTIHDLQHEYFPEFFSEQTLDYRKTNYKKSADLCDQIIVSFQHVRKDIVHFLDIDDEKITVTGLGAENRKNMLIDSKIDIRKKYDISGCFILYPAQTWKHKNHLRLLQAIKLVATKYGISIHLICTGKKTEYYSTIHQYVMANGLEKTVTFLDYVPDDDLRELYKQALFVVIPTLYEAGSFPLIEAMTLRKPVICSNVTSLPETIGDTQFIFNPYDSKEIAVKIAQMSESKEMRQTSINNSEKQLKKLNWESKVKNFIKGYENAIDHFNEYMKFQRLYGQKFKIETKHELEITRINQIIDSIPDDAKIIIYAAGIHTQHLLKQTNLAKKKILCIVDKSLHGNTLCGYKIENINALTEIKSDFILISSFKYQNEIADYLKKDIAYKGKIIELYDNYQQFTFY